jgi:hypothetical protein
VHVLLKCQYIEDIRRLRGDMDFMFEWRKQYLTSEILFLTRVHKSISSRNRLMFCLLYGLIQSDKNTRKDDM